MSEAPSLHVEDGLQSIPLGLCLLDDQLRCDQTDTEHLVSCEVFRVPLTYPIDEHSAAAEVPVPQHSMVVILEESQDRGRVQVGIDLWALSPPTLVIN